MDYNGSVVACQRYRGGSVIEREAIMAVIGATTTEKRKAGQKALFWKLKIPLQI